MSAEVFEKPLFFSIRKNSSYFMWRPFGDFFDFSSICIETIGDSAFTVWEGGCLKVQQLGKKYLASAMRYKKLRDGIYLLTDERAGKYLFLFVRPLRRNI